MAPRRVFGATQVKKDGEFVWKVLKGWDWEKLVLVGKEKGEVS